MNRMEMVLAKEIITEIVNSIIGERESIWSDGDGEEDLLVLELSGSGLTYQKADKIFTAIAEAGYKEVPLGIRVSNNDLGRIPESICFLSGLTALWAMATGIEELPADIFHNLRDLREIALDHNRLTVLPGGLGGLKDLWYLSVEGNELTAVPSDLVEELPPMLEYLNLVDNRIEVIPREISEHPYFGPECSPELQRK